MPSALSGVFVAVRPQKGRAVIRSGPATGALKCVSCKRLEERGPLPVEHGISVIVTVLPA